MPKRVIDFDAMWGSDKLACCAEWAQAEYAWFYGLADASGCFELTNLRVIWGRVAAIRCNLTIERLEQVFNEFQDKGLLFVWELEGKRYGHWTGSDVPGRLPPPSWRMRLERLAPPVPKQQLAAYMSKFSRGRAALQGGGFSVDYAQASQQDKFAGTVKHFAYDSEERNSANYAQDKPSVERSLDGGLKAGIEAGQAQDRDWNRKLEQEREGFTQGVRNDATHRASQLELGRKEKSQPALLNHNSKTDSKSKAHSESAGLNPGAGASQDAQGQSAQAVAVGISPAAPVYVARDKSFYVARELIVGQGPSGSSVRVKPEVLERIRARERARDG
jgi:hypothetical protein